jgi:Protein of unknown function (DUF1189)
MIGIASRLWRAFYDAGAYREVAGARIESCLAHLALAVFVVWVPSTFAMTSGFGTFAQAAARAFAGMPDVHIENGTARLDPPGRHEVQYEGKAFVVFDPSMSVDDALANEQGFFLTGRQLVIVQHDRSQARLVELAQFGDRVVTEADVQRWLAAAGRYGAIALFPFAVAFSFVWRLALAAALALGGLGVARALGSKTAYERSLRIATLAVVPGLFAATLAQTSGHAAWWPGWLGALCAIAYAVFGIRADRGAEPAQAP